MRDGACALSIIIPKIRVNLTRLLPLIDLVCEPNYTALRAKGGEMRKEREGEE